MSGKHIHKAYPLRLKDKQREKLELYVRLHNCTKLEAIESLIDNYLPDSKDAKSN